MNNKFKKLGLSEDLLYILDKKGFEIPTEIQEKAIPLVLEGKDVIGGSATGSGKTLAFSSSIIENLKPNENVQALILTPTRELAEQVSVSIKEFSKGKNLNVVSVYGGVSINPQIRNLAVADIVVGTPGRILDHIQRKTLRLDKINFLVIDEVDRLFDMGFIEDVEKIINQCSKDRQTMLFSATISPDVHYLAKKYTKNPIEVSVDSYVDYSMLEQVFYDVPNHLKFSLLVHLMKKEDSDLIMVFCSTRRNVDFINYNLQKQGINSQAIHGGLNQGKRNSVMKSFQGKGPGVLVCTDVAARGLDIDNVTHVYNYDLPNSSKEYIHRIGRTARAGKSGKAINILSSRDYDNFREIMSDDSLRIEREDLPEIEVVSVSTNSTRSRRGGSRGRSGSRNYKGNKGKYKGRNSRKRNSRGGNRKGNKGSGGKGGYQGGKRSRGKGKKRKFNKKRDPRGGMYAQPRGRC